MLLKQLPILGKMRDKIIAKTDKTAKKSEPSAKCWKLC